jgi:hypothetical protein
MDQDLLGSNELKMKFFELRSGIYFLYNGAELVYIGQATNISRRIIEHFSDGTKQFTHVRYNVVPIESLFDVETTLIRAFKPKYNMTCSDVDQESRSRTTGVISFRAVALKHHLKPNGYVNVKIRFYFNGSYFYVPTNLYVKPEYIIKGKIVDNDVNTNIDIILKKYQDCIKYIPRNETISYVRKKIKSFKL